MCSQLGSRRNVQGSHREKSSSRKVAAESSASSIWKMCALSDSSPSTGSLHASMQYGPERLLALSRATVDSRDGAVPISSGFVASRRFAFSHWRAQTYAVRHRWIPLLWTQGKTYLCPDAFRCFRQCARYVILVLLRYFQLRHRQDPTRLWEYLCLLNASRDLTFPIHVAHSSAKDVFVCIFALQ